MLDSLDTRTRSIVNQLLVVAATLLLGSAIHISVVTGEVAVTSPAVVLRVLVGGVCGAAGYAFRVKPDREAPVEARTGTESADAEGEGFDPEASPLDPADFEDLEADDRET